MEPSDPEGGDGGFTRVDQTNPNTIYHTFAGDGPGFFRRSDDNGATWMNIGAGINPNGTDNSDFYVPYQIDQSNSSRLILGTDHLYESLNKGANFHIIASPGVAGFDIKTTIDAIGLSKSAPNTIYVGDDAGNIFVSVNDGTSWVKRNIPAVADHINELVVDPTNSLSVYAVRDRFGAGKVFHSVDGGTTWTDISGNLPDLPTYSLALDTVNNVLYVGNDNGVFASANDGATWSVFGTGLPNVQVRELVLNSTLNILAAGTHGRSVWEISTVPVPPPPPPPPPTPPLPFNPENETNQTSDAALNLGTLAVGQPVTLTALEVAPLPDGRNDYDWFSFTPGAGGNLYRRRNHDGRRQRGTPPLYTPGKYLGSTGPKCGPGRFHAVVGRRRRGGPGSPRGGQGAKHLLRRPRRGRLPVDRDAGVGKSRSLTVAARNVLAPVGRGFRCRDLRCDHRRRSSGGNGYPDG